MYNYCTIITENYLAYALALLDSLKDIQEKVHLHVLISDKSRDESKITFENWSNISFYFSNEICRSEIATIIHNKYSVKDHDAFRWSMKPVFLNFLIREKNLDKVIYLDSDLYFYDNPSFLFRELNDHNVILTPHWRSINPLVDPNNFHILLTSGHYNAGFVGINKNATDAMDWWASACAYKCEIDPEKSLFVDQGYLDLLPIYFDKIKILKHKGCNVANWNQVECKRVQQVDNSVLINDEAPIVFIHFTKSTIRGILNRQDKNLSPYLLKYERTLKQYGINKIEKERESIQYSKYNRRTSIVSKLQSKLQLKKK